MACILPQHIEELQSLFDKNGGVAWFRSLTGKERVDFFENFLTKGLEKLSPETRAGFRKDAEVFVSRIEAQILKAADEEAIISWSQTAKTDAGRNDILDIVIKNSAALDPENKDMLDVLVRRKLGFSMDSQQATELMQLADTANTSREQFMAQNPDYDDNTNMSQERFLLGKALAEFQDKYNELSLKGKTRNQSKVGKAIYAIAGTWKSLRASFDVSFGRQLSSAFYAGEKGTRAAWVAGIKTFWKGLSDPEYFDQMRAMLLTRKNALNGNYERFGLDIGLAEEAFPESRLNKIPGLGRVFSASEASFNVASQFARANIFDARWEMAMKDLNGDENAVINLFREGKIGEYINSITGRGSVQRYGLNKETGERFFNYMIFSPRWLASRADRIVDLKYLPNIGGNRNDVKVMRGRAAAKQLVFSLALGAMTRAAFDDDDDKWQDFINPISGGFMQGKIGDLRIDQTFGVGGFVRDVSRMFTGLTRTREGVVRKQSGWTTFGRWISGKESPFASGIKTAGQLVGYGLGITDELPKTYSGEEYTLGKAAIEFLPISAENAIEAFAGEGSWASLLLDVFGVSSTETTEYRTKEGLSAKVIREQGRIARAVQKASPGTTLAANSKLAQVPGAKGERIRREFQTAYNRAMESFISSARYSRMTMEERDSEQRRIRTKIQNELKRKYGIK